MSKVILYIATSKDGFIADQNGGVDWLPQPSSSEELEIVGYNNLINRIQNIVMGSRSFQQILSFGEWGWLDKTTTVFTSQNLHSDLSCIKFTNSSPNLFIEKIKAKQSEQDIWLLGGACLAQSFAENNLINEIILTEVSQKLGAGVPLNISFDAFSLRDEKELFNGMVQRVYDLNGC